MSISIAVPQIVSVCILSTNYWYYHFAYINEM